mmetsp:Transcript_2907/g.10612  ORF Transcript_2907/g.10612 Transcript_2907/m.10612 type:complete len:324 (-) Transcript_2907:854-1825(-)
MASVGGDRLHFMRFRPAEVHWLCPGEDCLGEIGGVVELSYVWYANAEIDQVQRLTCSDLRSAANECEPYVCSSARVISLGPIQNCMCFATSASPPSTRAVPAPARCKLLQAAAAARLPSPPLAPSAAAAAFPPERTAVSLARAAAFFLPDSQFAVKLLLCHRHDHELTCVCATVLEVERPTKAQECEALRLLQRKGDLGPPRASPRLRAHALHPYPLQRAAAAGLFFAIGELEHVSSIARTLFSHILTRARGGFRAWRWFGRLCRVVLSRIARARRPPPPQPRRRGGSRGGGSLARARCPPRASRARPVPCLSPPPQPRPRAP